MNWKKVVSMLLVGVMTLSMTACGGKDAGTSAAGTESANAGTSAGTEATTLGLKILFLIILFMKNCTICCATE